VGRPTAALDSRDAVSYRPEPPHVRFGGSQGIAALARRNRRRLFKLRARRSLPDKERRQPWAGITAGAQSSDRFEGENQALELWRRSPHARRGHGCSPRRRKADRQSPTSDSTVAVRLVA